MSRLQHALTHRPRSIAVLLSVCMSVPSCVRQVQAAFTAGAVLIFGGWVDAKKTVGYVDWSLLLLIGSALGLSRGIVNSGLADYVGGAIRDSGISADASLFVLYAFTMVSRVNRWLPIISLAFLAFGSVNLYV